LVTAGAKPSFSLRCGWHADSPAYVHSACRGERSCVRVTIKVFGFGGRCTTDSVLFASATAWEKLETAMSTVLQLLPLRLGFTFPAAFRVDRLQRETSTSPSSVGIGRSVAEAAMTQLQPARSECRAACAGNPGRGPDFF